MGGYISKKNENGEWVIKINGNLENDDTHAIAEPAAEAMKVNWDEDFIVNKVTSGINDLEASADILDAIHYFFEYVLLKVIKEKTAEALSYAYIYGAVDAMEGVEAQIDHDGSVVARTYLWDGIEITQKMPTVMARASEFEDFDFADRYCKIKVSNSE